MTETIDQIFTEIGERKPARADLDKILDLARAYESQGGKYTSLTKQVELPSGDKLTVIQTKHQSSVDEGGRVLSKGFGNCTGVLVSSPDHLHMKHVFSQNVYVAADFVKDTAELDTPNQVIVISKHLGTLIDIGTEIIRSSTNEGTLQPENIVLVEVDRNHLSYDNKTTFRVWAELENGKMNYRITSDDKWNIPIRTKVQTFKELQDELAAQEVRR